MHIGVLAATGRTGRLLVIEALKRGHTVTAAARGPLDLAIPAGSLLRQARVDVYDNGAVASALSGTDAVVSALGRRAGSPADVLSTGAAALAAGVHDPGTPPHFVWLGTFGVGASAGSASAPARLLLRLVLRDEIGDKVRADEIVLGCGGSVVHAGPLSDAPLSPVRRIVDLSDTPRRILPRSVARATVAAAMLDEAEHRRFAGGVAVPLDA